MVHPLPSRRPFGEPRFVFTPLLVALVMAAALACERSPSPSSKTVAVDAGEPEAPAPAQAASTGEDVGGEASGGDSEDTGDEARFALALTGHRRQTYVGDLDEIKRRGVLRVLTRNNSTSYFLYRGVEAGFHYELARWLARELGVRLEMVVPRARRDLVPWLIEGKGDVIIASMSTDASRADRVRFSRPYLETPWVVVTKKGAPPLRALADLVGEKVLVKPSSGALPRLRASGVEGLALASAQETLESEDLLDAVAAGEARAAVVEERVAKVELMHRDDVRIAFTLPGGDDIAGIAVRRGDDALWAAVDDFVRRHRKTTDWNVTFMKYHSSKNRTAAVRQDALRADKRGRVSPWDDAFQRAGAEHGVDWRLLAAQAYQESRFDPEARSPMGALGLMQLLPSTAEELGCPDPLDPRASIAAAARYLGKLMKRFERPRAAAAGADKDTGHREIALKDRVRFALASYNAGPAHLDDARLLAAEQGLDPDRWFGNVEQAMLLLAKPVHYQKAKHGFARGSETVRYVSEIQTRYDAYVALTEEPASDSSNMARDD